MFLPLTKSVSLTETLDCGAWLGLLFDKVALNDFQMLETCLMEIEYSLSLSLDGWCPKSGLWGKLVTWAKTSVWLSWLMSNFWFLRKTHDLSKKPQGDVSWLMSNSGLWGKLVTWVKNLRVMCPGWCWLIHCRLGDWPGLGWMLDMASDGCRLYDNVRNVSGSGECEY